MIDFLNHIVCCFGVPMFRVIHLIMFMLTIPFLPRAIREMKELFTDEAK